MKHTILVTIFGILLSLFTPLVIMVCYNLLIIPAFELPPFKFYQFFAFSIFLSYLVFMMKDTKFEEEEDEDDRIRKFITHVVYKISVGLFAMLFSFIYNIIIF